MNTPYTEHVTEAGRSLRVYDNVFDFAFRTDLLTFSQASNFRIGWADSHSYETSMYKCLHSSFSPEDITRLGLFAQLQQSALATEFEGYTVTQCVLNLSTPADSHFVHTHGHAKVVLLYVNLDWQDGWHGETLFYSNDRKSIVFASPYTPNRAIVFDPRIPHSIRPQSRIATQYRFTLAIVLDKADGCGD